MPHRTLRPERGGVKEVQGEGVGRGAREASRQVGHTGEDGAGGVGEVSLGDRQG